MYPPIFCGGPSNRGAIKEPYVTSIRVSDNAQNHLLTLRQTPDLTPKLESQPLSKVPKKIFCLGRPLNLMPSSLEIPSATHVQLKVAWESLCSVSNVG